jgi:hypothetical protein
MQQSNVQTAENDRSIKSAITSSPLNVIITVCTDDYCQATDDTLNQRSMVTTAYTYELVDGSLMEQGIMHHSLLSAMIVYMEQVRPTGHVRSKPCHLFLYQQ